MLLGNKIKIMMCLMLGLIAIILFGFLADMGGKIQQLVEGQKLTNELLQYQLHSQLKIKPYEK